MKRIKFNGMSAIYALGTAISITFVMVVAMAYYAMLAPVAPEENRQRILYGDRFSMQWQYGGNPDQTASTSAGGTNMKGMMEFFYQMKTPEAVCAIDPYAEVHQLTTGSRKNGNERMAELLVKSTDDRFFQVFSLEFVEGKPYTFEDIRNYGPENPVAPVVITQHAARKLFGKEEGVLGQKIATDFGLTCLVKGVVKDVSPVTTISFADVYTAFDNSSFDPTGNDDKYVGDCMPVLLARSVSDFDAIRQEWRDVEHRINQKFKDHEAGHTFTMTTPLSYAQDVLTSEDGEKGSSDRLPWLILSFVILLLVPAVNMSGMVSWKLDGQLSELAVRKAFGANRRQLLWRVLLQNLRITCIGGLLGLVLSWIFLHVGRAWIFKALLPMNQGIDFSEYSLPAGVFFSPWIFLITFLACAVLNLVATLLPAWHSLRQDIVSGIKGHSIRRIGVWVLVIELTLVTLAAWFVIDPLVVNYTRTHGERGFEADRYMVMEMTGDRMKLSEFREDDDYFEQCYNLFEEITSVIRSMPEVECASLTLDDALPGAPEDSRWKLCSTMEDTTRIYTMAEVLLCPNNRILQTMGQEVLYGDLSIEDIEQGNFDLWNEAVISRSAALKFFGTEKAVGKYLIYYGKGYDKDANGEFDFSKPHLVRAGSHNANDIPGGMKVRAVVSDILPNCQHNELAACYVFQNGSLSQTQYTLIRLKEGVNPAQFRKKIDEMAHQLSTDYVNVKQISTLEEIWHKSRYGTLADMYLNICFAIFLVVNVMLGVGSSFWVLTRKRREEIGVRRSFGASRLRIIMDFVLRGWLLCAIGLALGTAIFFVWRSPSDLHITPLSYFSEYYLTFADHNVDWITTPWQHIAVILSLITLLLIVVVTLSTALPAWMTTREKPVEALKEE